VAGQLCADIIILVSRGASGHWPQATVEYVSVNTPYQVLVLLSLEKTDPQMTEEEADQQPVSVFNFGHIKM
jgi:hypothetical protein